LVRRDEILFTAPLPEFLLQRTGTHESRPNPG
jgi:hypothetical protein